MIASTLSETAGPGDGQVRRGSVGLLKAVDSLSNRFGTRHDRVLDFSAHDMYSVLTRGPMTLSLSTDQPELNTELAG